jgi:hypothetical protein
LKSNCRLFRKECKSFDLEFKRRQYFNNCIKKSIEEFKEEDDELKHCVYTNEYYLKEKMKFSQPVDGRRAETIELKLPDLKIEQSHGLKSINQTS